MLEPVPVLLRVMLPAASERAPVTINLPLVLVRNPPLAPVPALMMLRAATVSVRPPRFHLAEAPFMTTVAASGICSPRPFVTDPDPVMERVP